MTALPSSTVGHHCPALSHSSLSFLLIYFWLRWVFVAAQGFLSSCSKQGLLFVAVRGLRIAVASLVVEHGL